MSLLKIMVKRKQTFGKKEIVHNIRQLKTQANFAVVYKQTDNVTT